MKNKEYLPLIINFVCIMSAGLILTSSGLDALHWQYWAIAMILTVSSIYSFSEGVDQGAEIVKEVWGINDFIKKIEEKKGGKK